jgi:hypothetical protein
MVGMWGLGVWGWGRKWREGEEGGGGGNGWRGFVLSFFFFKMVRRVCTLIGLFFVGNCKFVKMIDRSYESKTLDAVQMLEDLMIR